MGDLGTQHLPPMFPNFVVAVSSFSVGFICINWLVAMSFGQCGPAICTDQRCIATEHFVFQEQLLVFGLFFHHAYIIINVLARHVFYRKRLRRWRRATPKITLDNVTLDL